MKKTLITSILGVAALFSVTVPGLSQRRINLNNYSASGNQIIYGSGFGANTGLGLRNGTPSGITWTIGFYCALGDVTASVNPDPSGMGIPFGGGLTLATGAAGDTTTIGNQPAGGYFTSINDAVINGWTAGPITVEAVAYSGSDYASSFLRGHSTAFLLTPADSTSIAPKISTMAGGMPTFAISVPEPATIALAGIGAALFMAVRRNRRYLIRS